MGWYNSLLGCSCNIVLTHWGRMMSLRIPIKKKKWHRNALLRRWLQPKMWHFYSLNKMLLMETLVFLSFVTCHVYNDVTNCFSDLTPHSNLKFDLIPNCRYRVRMQWMKLSTSHPQVSCCQASPKPPPPKEFNRKPWKCRILPSMWYTQTPN